MNENIETLDELFENTKELPYKNKLKLIREFIYEKKEYLEDLEETITTETTKQEFQDYINTDSKIRLEIHNANLLERKIKIDRKKEKKKKVKEFFKSIIPTKGR